MWVDAADDSQGSHAQPVMRGIRAVCGGAEGLGHGSGVPNTAADGFVIAII